MGADLIVAFAVFPRGRRPKWKGAEQRVQHLARPEAVWPKAWHEQVWSEDTPDDETRAGSASQLAEDLKQFRSLWKGTRNWRDVTFLHIGGNIVVLTASMSWGDTWPTYELFERLWLSGVLAAAGFTAS